ncbi:unnamed protein product [Dicrocoelium dendriticum]|nr:unnamed protein product [Dicrocoelium dendriticum]
MFLVKLVECILPDGANKSLCEEEEKELVKELMAAIDTNQDNRIDLREMAQLLPTDEEFLVIFQDDHKIRSSIEFMKIWKEFDKDHSGYIEADELKSFLALLMGPSIATVETFEEKLMEYTDAILNLFDINGDGKLQLSEMSRLLPAKENFLCRPIFKKKGCITSDDIEHVFKFYDADHNGTIENDELYGFLKDLLELTNQDYDDSDLAFTKAAILKDWDLNHDGKISLAEMRMLLLAYSINEGKPRTHLQVDPQSAFWRRRRRSSNRPTKAQSTTHKKEL